MEKRDYRKEPVRIFIAAGRNSSDHSGIDHGLQEADCNLAIAMLMHYDLRRHGVQVQVSHVLDTEDHLHNEVVLCNAYAPDFAIAIHTRASQDTAASGFEVYHQLKPWINSKPSVQMAQIFDGNVTKYLNITTRGLKTNNDLYWLTKLNAPSILVNNFFLNGPRASWYREPTQLDKLSKAYVHSILEFFGIPYRGDTMQTLRCRVLHDDLSISKECTCSSLLVDGHQYVQICQFAKAMGLDVYYDEISRKIILYPPEYFAESPFQNCLLKLSDFPSKTERILVGLPTEHMDMDDYNFDEYDYDELGNLEQTQWLEKHVQ